MKSKMIRNNIKVSQEYLKLGDIDDEFIYRQLVRQTVTDMSIDILKKLFNLTKTDPNSKESEVIIDNPKTPQHIRDKLLSLQDLELIEFELEIGI